MLCQSLLYSIVTLFYTCTHTYIYIFLKILFSIIIYPRILTIVACAIQ